MKKLFVILAAASMFAACEKESGTLTDKFPVTDKSLRIKTIEAYAIAPDGSTSQQSTVTCFYDESGRLNKRRIVHSFPDLEIRPSIAVPADIENEFSYAGDSITINQYMLNYGNRNLIATFKGFLDEAGRIVKETMTPQNSGRPLPPDPIPSPASVSDRASVRAPMPHPVPHPVGNRAIFSSYDDSGYLVKIQDDIIEQTFIYADGEIARIQLVRNIPNGPGGESFKETDGYTFIASDRYVDNTSLNLLELMSGIMDIDFYILPTTMTVKGLIGKQMKHLPKQINCDDKITEVKFTYSEDGQGRISEINASLDRTFKNPDGTPDKRPTLKYRVVISYND